MRHRFRRAQWLPYGVDFVFAFFVNPSNLPKLFPEWQRARIDEIELHPASLNGISPHPVGVAAGRGTKLTLSFRPTPLAPVRVSWVALIEDFHWNERFCDRQMAGPFQYWRHCHRMQAWQSEETGEHGTLLIDTIEYELPFGRIGHFANRIAMRRMIMSLFEHRHRRTEQLLRELSEGEEFPA